MEYQKITKKKIFKLNQIMLDLLYLNIVSDYDNFADILELRFIPVFFLGEVDFLGDLTEFKTLLKVPKTCDCFKILYCSFT